MRIEARIQNLERVRARPHAPSEDTDKIRMELALRTLSTKTLEQLEMVLEAQMAGRPLTEQQQEEELEAIRLFDAAFAAVLIPNRQTGDRL
ncbi:MAG TPA: hypothetical protein VHU83_06350 [Bryobacteraceae bacterium]|jgi:hypothetical protein|nr:hypothetical protein [Bryobacteraceae bacterium]